MPIALSVAGVLLMVLVAAAAPNDHTLDMAMPLLRLPALAGPASTYLTCAAIAAQGLGLLGMLHAAGQGWRPSPRKLLTAGGVGACLLTLATPVGSADVASYAAYGRIASLGLDPYRVVPADLGGTYAHLVSSVWARTPSVYGPVATFVQRLAADIGGDHVLVTIGVLMAANTVVYLATGLILVRVASDRSRAALLWAANPLLLGLLVGGGHVDTYLALFAVCAAALASRRPDWLGEALIGALLGLACGVKISAALLAVGLSWPLLRERSWRPLLVRAVSCLGVIVLLYAPVGLHAFAPLSGASQLVSVPSVWQLLQLAGRLLIGPAVAAALISAAWPALMLVTASLLLRLGAGPARPDRLEQPRTAHALALGWNIAAPWSMPWYTAMTWPLAALLPRARTNDYLLTALTLGLALAHNTGGHGWSW
ncbi:polyprenol phosphomannose-dependent alpha 1,6 mannosyltransferase MptB [Streptacidiphilus jiangxiensis]|uniref:polyprenol phosphomannose-dependent alpha 1,6 mannosyltransferase MptB n=1 Tax=Streptacidiphilus jiangxiensis TaxID=235985 RepID=UPI000694C779|nr:polyprenol phosphomannose-dependent alpha 1,6 mannosyltransferase MptB [Streptacidiphilus jiangxiensis]